MSLSCSTDRRPNSVGETPSKIDFRGTPLDVTIRIGEGEDDTEWSLTTKISATVPIKPSVVTNDVFMAYSNIGRVICKALYSLSLNDVKKYHISVTKSEQSSATT